MMRSDIASEAIREHGVLVTNSQGNLAENPACKTAKDAVTQYRLVVKQLGLERAPYVEA